MSATEKASIMGGMAATPAAPQATMPQAPQATMPQPGVQPSENFLNPAPAAPTAPVERKWVVQGSQYDESFLLSNGWTLELLQQQGQLVQ